MGFSTAEQTTQITPTRIASMSGEKNATVPATSQTYRQVRLGPVDRSQQNIILQHQSGDLIRSIPAPTKLEILRDPDCKKPKPSPKVLTLNSISSSYSIASNVSRR
jgi:hypothetical protein